MSETSDRTNDAMSGRDAPKGDPMREPATYTTPPRADEATEPPPAMPQGDGTPDGAPGTPANGKGATTGTAARAPGASPSAGGKPPSRMRTVWQGEHRFDTGRPDGPSVRLDASARTGPSPVDALVGALAACVSVDVVDILAKRRTPVESLTVDTVAERANAVPARVVAVDMTFTITGAGIERVHAERAIDLAVTKYCSVRDSLDPELPVRWTLRLNDE
ncbi:MAG TPA: OsmC family protein [Gemmatimonadaceae bacterium]|nr:OsmC family protein [Gemmatimonadaceae bacterium]